MCVGQWQPGEESAVLPVAIVPRAREDANSSESVGEPKSVQYPDGVGTDRETCAYLTKHGGLLVDVDLKASLTQRQCSGQPRYRRRRRGRARCDGRAVPERAMSSEMPFVLRLPHWSSRRGSVFALGIR